VFGDRILGSERKAGFITIAYGSLADDEDLVHPSS